jgi:hypothetical protein
LKNLQPDCRFGVWEAGWRFGCGRCCGVYCFGAILAPAADPLNMMMMAFPLILLYYLSAALLFFVNRNRHAPTHSETRSMPKDHTNIWSDIAFYGSTFFLSFLFGVILLFSYAGYRHLL